MPSDESQRTMLGMEVVLRHVPELIARILLAEPLGPAEPRGVIRIDFGLEDSTKLVLHSGVALASVDSWGNEYVQRLVETPDFTPIVCTAQVAADNADDLVEPFAIYDGWLGLCPVCAPSFEERRDENSSRAKATAHPSPHPPPRHVPHPPELSEKAAETGRVPAYRGMSLVCTWCRDRGRGRYQTDLERDWELEDTDYRDLPSSAR